MSNIPTVNVHRVCKYRNDAFLRGFIAVNVISNKKDIIKLEIFSVYCKNIAT